MAAIWVALVASGMGLAFVARGAGPLPGDLALSRSIQQPAPDGLAGFLLVHASDLVWLLWPLAVLVALVGRRWSAALFISLAGSTGVLVGEAIKPLAARPRPTEDLVRVQETPESYGFPSSTAFFRRGLPRDGRLPGLAGAAAASGGDRHARDPASPALVERSLARLRRGALGHRRPRRMATGWCLAARSGGRPPLVVVQADHGLEGRRCYEKKKASAEMT